MDNEGRGTMEKEYDVVIIGTGTAGRTFAGKVARSGLKIAIVDSREYGGTCPLRGCDPKEVLTDMAHNTDRINRLRGKGIRIETPLVIDWPSLIEFKRTFTEGYSITIEKYLADVGIDTYHGRAHFEDKNTIVVGGGYISLEFAHVVRRTGAEVTVLHRSDRLLRQFDADMVDTLLKASEAAGIRILTDKPAVSVERDDSGFVVKTGYKTGTDSETHIFRAGMVVHGVGRVPDIEDLHLENAGIRIEKGTIAVDKYMRTTNPRIYAGGDCASEGMQLTPVAVLQGEVAAANVLNENSAEADYTGIPGAIFTIPVLASVGISAAKDNDKYKVIFRDRSIWNSSRRARMEFAASKVIIDETNDRIMGAHILGPNAGEAINIFAAVMRLGLKASDIKKLVFSYPTICSDIPYML
ncbi:MAG: glutathione reductase [Euryarchaeota archaeon]|nr:glutathione reductase [Euryarchaeota archaeon]